MIHPVFANEWERQLFLYTLFVTVVKKKLTNPYYYIRFLDTVLNASISAKFSFHKNYNE